MKTQPWLMGKEFIWIKIMMVQSIILSNAYPCQGKGNDRTYVPLRFVAEAMGAEVEYKRVNGKNYIEIWTGKVEKPKDDVGFIEPEIEIAIN